MAVPSFSALFKGIGGDFGHRRIAVFHISRSAYQILACFLYVVATTVKASLKRDVRVIRNHGALTLAKNQRLRSSMVFKFLKYIDPHWFHSD